MVILTIFILPIEEHGISLHLFCVILNFFNQHCLVFRVQLLCLVPRLIPGYVILFDAIVYGIISLISLSNILLLGYANATDFCILILYPETFLCPEFIDEPQ